MRLYYSPASPYVRKVMIVLHETGQVDDVALLPVAGTPVDPDTMPVAINPMGKIPTLERDDGPAIYDSRVICRFLDDRAKGGLYPAAPRLWETLTLEATGDGILDAALLMMYEIRTRPEEMRVPAWVEGQWAKIARALDVLNARWISHLNGPLDIGQITVGAALGYLDLRLGARNWREGRPDLTAWAADFGRRDSMIATMPKG